MGTHQEKRRGGAPLGNRNNAGVPSSPQERQLAGTGINIQRHTEFRWRAGKTCHRESRRYRAQESGGGSATVGSGVSIGGGRCTLWDLSSEHVWPIFTSQSGAPEDARLSVCR